MPSFFITFCFFFSVVVVAEAERSCKLSCGSTVVPYPFYYHTKSSANLGCPKRHFQLHCHNGHLYFPLNIENVLYKVLTFNPTSIVIDPLLPNCSMPNIAMFTLSHWPYFSISPGNYLQLYGCSFCINDEGYLNITGQLPGNPPLLGCSSLYGHPCCQLLNPNPSNTTRIPDFSSFANCTVVTSLALKSGTSNFPSLSLNVEIGLRLDWALPGHCRQSNTCSPHAKCTRSPTLNGHTCRCLNGYVGDGYINGTACMEESCEKGWTIDSKGNCVKVAMRWVWITALVAGIVGGATVVGGILVGYFIMRKKNIVSMGRRNGGEQLANLLSLQREAINSEVFSHKELDRATKSFASERKLGDGACGAVYAGGLSDGRMVAVKRIHYLNTQGVKQVVNEVNVLSTAKHKNLVRLLGCCLERGDPLLVFEYVANGTLAQHLQGERGNGLDWATRLSIAISTAEALAYLHSFDPPIYHRDVKSSNILLDYEFNAKVADFGLSRLGLGLADNGTHISTVPQGTPGYVDPEYHQNFHLSDKSDVYSFGVVLVEIISAMKPLDFSRDKKEVSLANLAVAKIGGGCLDDIIDPFLLLAAGKSAPLVRSMIQRLAELAFRCLAYNKDARPSMVEVMEELGLIQEASRTTISGVTRDVALVSPTTVQARWDSKQTSPANSSVTDSLKSF